MYRRHTALALDWKSESGLCSYNRIRCGRRSAVLRMRPISDRLRCQPVSCASARPSALCVHTSRKAALLVVGPLAGNLYELAPDFNGDLGGTAASGRSSSESSARLAKA